MAGDSASRRSRCRSRRTRRSTDATFAPDVVIFRGNARQIMLLSEAARAAGAFEPGTAMGRPACAMLPQALGTAGGVASVGCIGNRVYTELGDDELYLAVPAKALGRVLETARHDPHRQRRARKIPSPAGGSAGVSLGSLRAGVVKLADAPDSKSGGVYPP